MEKEQLLERMKESLRRHIAPMVTQEGRPTEEDVSIMASMAEAYCAILENGIFPEEVEALQRFVDPLAVAAELEDAGEYWKRGMSTDASDLDYWMETISADEAFPVLEAAPAARNPLQRRFPLTQEVPAREQTASLQESLERRRRIVSSDRPLIYLGGESPLVPLLNGGVRELRPEEIVFQYGIARQDERLQFTLKSVIPADEVFGLETGRDDDLTAFAYYSLKRGVVEKTLDVKIFEEDGSKEYREYPLSGSEQAILLTKMEESCLKQTGMSLEAQREQYVQEEQTPAAAPKRKGDPQHTIRKKQSVR